MKEMQRLRPFLFAVGSARALNVYVLLPFSVWLSSRSRFLCVFPNVEVRRRFFPTRAFFANLKHW